MLLVYDLQRQRGRFGGAAANITALMAGRKTTQAICCLCVFFGALPPKSCSVPEHPGVPTCVALHPGREGGREGRDVLAEVPPEPAGCPPWCWGPSLHAWQRAGTMAAVFEGQGLFQVCLLLFFTGRLRNHAIIKLDWSILAELR